MTIETVQEQVVNCPKCGTEVRLTESLAAPLVAKVRLDYERRLERQAEETAAREKRLGEERRALEQARDGMELEVRAAVSERLGRERQALIAHEAARARESVESELREQSRKLEERDERLLLLDGKLRDAQAAQAELIRKEQELDDQRRELELRIEQSVQTRLEGVRAQAQRHAEESLELRVKEREQTIDGLKRQIDELKRRAEQGSQQAQGEVLEVALEGQLRQRFPLDSIEPVGKGEFGGDVVQVVRDSGGEICGKILWESKRTKIWQEGWLGKLRADQRTAGAELAVLVTQAMPKEVTHFDQMDGIWVSSLSCTMPVAVALRQGLIGLAQARRAGEGQETKVQQVYAYLTGRRFRQRVEAIVEHFQEMHDDLNRERKVMVKHWAKREEQIRCVIDATAGMYGDLQGIAGKSLQEIEALGNPLMLSGE